MKSIALIASCIALASSMPIIGAFQNSNPLMNPLAKVEARGKTLPTAVLRVWYHQSDPSGKRIEDIRVTIGADANGPSSGRLLTQALVLTTDDGTIEDKVQCNAFKDFSSTSAGVFTTETTVFFGDDPRGFTRITNFVCEVVE